MVISYWQGSSVSESVYTDRTEADIPKGERTFKRWNANISENDYS